MFALENFAQMTSDIEDQPFDTAFPNQNRGSLVKLPWFDQKDCSLLGLVGKIQKILPYLEDGLPGLVSG